MLVWALNGACKFVNMTLYIQRSLDTRRKSPRAAKGEGGWVDSIKRNYNDRFKFVK